ncbi:MAG: hypothetical protein V1659_04340 [Candidatus Woesearchaeota archaeon]
MKFGILVIICIIGLALIISACDPQRSGSGSYSGEYGRGESCGHLDEPCCQDMENRDIYGNWQPITYCYDYLDCRADTCVEGPEYAAYDRNADTVY